MAGDKQLFAPVPLRAMAMDLSGLELSVLTCVAAHDRMSLVTGKGQGCRASNERMKEMIGCNFSRLCSALTRLVDLELLHKERLGRHTVYRVIYTDDDRLLFGNVSGRSIRYQPASGDEPIGCRHLPETDSFQPENGSQYIPLNGGRYSVETGEDNSSEDARFAARRLCKIEFSENPGAQMARLERAITDGVQVNRLEWCDWLDAQFDAGENPANVQRARRLSETLVELMNEAEYRKWGEVHGWVDSDGKWDEIDFDKTVWTIPADRMKMRKPHRVPLSPQAVAVLEEAKAMRQSEHIFPNGKGVALSDMALTKTLRDMGMDCTAHGFRSSFRDWAAEQTSAPGEVAEAALAHAVPSAVEAAYKRTDFFDRRRELMHAWGAFLEGQSNVVRLASAS